MASGSPRAIIIAGPNGAGKTTFAQEFLPAEGNCPTFINADLIAQGLSPFRPEVMAVELMFLQLPSADLAVERVRQRVAQGGHNIPEPDIRRRFARGKDNFDKLYRHAVDVWQVFDASQWPPVLLDNGVNS